MKKIVGNLLVIVFVVFISGCTGTQGPEVKSFKKVSDVFIKFNFPNLDPVSGEKLEFNDFDFSDNLYKMSKYNNVLKIKKQNNSYILKYKRGHLNDVIFKINFISQGNNVAFNLETVSNAIYSLKHPELSKKIEVDVKKIFSNLHKLTDAKAERKFPFNFFIPTNNSKNKIYNNMKNDEKYGDRYLKGQNVTFPKDKEPLIVHTIRKLTDTSFWTPLAGNINYKIIDNEDSINVLSCSGVLEYSINIKGITTASTKNIYLALENIREVIDRTSLNYHNLGFVKIDTDKIKAVDHFKNTFAQGTTTGNGRIMYIKNQSDSGDNFAIAVGGMLKYHSASLYGVSIGYGLTTSKDISAISGIGTELNTELSSVKRNHTVFSEGYINYSYSNLNLRLGRQVIDTPLAGSHDLRMIQNTFESYIATYEVSDFTLMAGNLQKWQGVDAGLDNRWLLTGDNGTWFGGITYLSDIEINAWLYNVSKLTKAIYADATYTQEIDKDISLSVAGQYLKETEIENSGIEAKIYGASVGFEANGFGLNLAYNKSNKIEAKGSFSGFGGRATFTSMDYMIIDEITLDSDAEAFVICASYSVPDFDLSLTYGDFTSEDSIANKAHFVEQDIVLEYNIYDNIVVTVIYVDFADKQNSANNWNQTRFMIGFDFYQ